MDPYKSGRLGAFLLTNHFNPDELLLVRLIRDTNHKAVPNAKRRQGFLDYISMKFPNAGFIQFSLTLQIHSRYM